MQCFDRNLLKFENGYTVSKLNQPEYNSGYKILKAMENLHTFEVKLPDNLTCKHCLIQVEFFSLFFQSFKNCLSNLVEIV